MQEIGRGKIWGRISAFFFPWKDWENAQKIYSW